MSKKWTKIKALTQANNLIFANIIGSALSKEKSCENLLTKETNLS